LFKQQISNGGPVTLTDRRVTRYFMTLPEAAELVLQAAAMSSGGEVFVLDMGQPIRILELARNMVELAGLTVRSSDEPGGDIEIVEIGLRPGEKLYEELLIGNNPSPTEHPRILKADEAFLTLDALLPKLHRVAALVESEDRSALLAALRDMVPEFRSDRGVMDWVHLQSREAALLAPVTRIA
jgi:FlaA1/EpsC-like NDP-sugar epimerase